VGVYGPVAGVDEGRSGVPKNGEGREPGGVASESCVDERDDDHRRARSDCPAEDAEGVGIGNACGELVHGVEGGRGEDHSVRLGESFGLVRPPVVGENGSIELREGGVVEPCAGRGGCDACRLPSTRGQEA
jgi:hypothetical protein